MSYYIPKSVLANHMLPRVGHVGLKLWKIISFDLVIQKL
jgi:hypothetical protein